MDHFRSKLGLRLALAVAACFLTITPARADFSTFANPFVDGYLADTSLIPITGPNFTSITSIMDPVTGLVITFSSPGNIRTVPGGGWLTWGSPPDTEAPAAGTRVLFFSGSSVTLTFSSALDIFGFEAEPNAFATFPMTAAYKVGASTHGTIGRSVAGSAGARLFAAETSDGFTSVTFSTSPGAFGFGIGHLRDSNPVPEPATLLLLGSGLVGVVCRKRKKV